MDSDVAHSNPTTPMWIARRLLLALAAPLLLLLAVGAVLSLQISGMNERSRWLDHTDAVIAEVQTLEVRLTRQEAGVRGYQADRNATYLEEFHGADPQPIAERLRRLVADNPAQQARVDELVRRYRDWHALATQTLAGGSIDRAVMDARRRLALENHQIIDQIRSVELGLRRQRAEDAAASKAVTEWVFIGLLLLTALTLGIFSRSSLLQVQRSFGAALAREREARAKVELEEWLAAGALAVAETLRGELTLDAIGNRALAVIAPYVGAELGVFFVADGSGFRRNGGFGVDSHAAGHDFFEDGEGLLGRAARDAAVTVIHDLPENFVKLRSGLGEGLPRCVAIAPARHEGRVLALLELAFLEPPEQRQLVLLKRIGEHLAATVRAAQQRQRLQELLEESQRQAEELQTQQEELRVANDELQAQGTALEASQAELRERQEELEASNAGLEQQASDLEQAQLELSTRARELERASQYKSEFLANMSHELRTPLNSSLILAKLLADNREGNLSEEQRKFAATIYSAGNDLLTLINDILDLSKIEAGRLDVHVTRTSIQALVEPLITTFKPVAAEQKLEFRIRATCELTREVDSDVQRIQQVLKNLLSNALKFTERGFVELGIALGPDTIEFRVTDSGIGIPRNQQAIIFEAFRQADGTTNRRYGGTGLGLSISRDLARLLGGDLRVDSEPGRGSSFTFTLPHSYSGPSAKPNAGELHAALVGESQRPPSSRPPAPRADAVVDDRCALDEEQRLLLVIEDDESFARILVTLAHDLDFQCIVALTAEEGLRLAMEHVPAAVLLDVKLPDRSGLSVLDRLKRDPRTRHIPVHVVSGADYSTQALAMGAFGYTLKPVAREELSAALRKMEDRLTRRLNRLLVVEDDGAQRDAICRLLDASDVETTAVATVHDALAQLRASTFDCVVTDLSLPDASGFDLLERMAADSAHAFPPVIVYTGRSLSEADEQQLRRYSSAIIVKGARSPERLLDEVTLFLHRVESELPPDRQRMLAQARDREKAFDGRRVLVVEDDVRNIFALSSLLEPKGVEVLIARNGRQGIEALEQQRNVDLVLMDIMMPEMDGLEAMRRIRQRPEWRDLPIVALTAKAMRDDQEKCLEAGANDYIPKPLDVDTLLSLLRVWMPK